MPKYLITKSRYINGEYIAADPLRPATVELPKGTKLDGGLQPVDEDGKVEVAKLKAHYATNQRVAAPTAVKHMGKRTADAEPI